MPSLVSSGPTTAGEARAEAYDVLRALLTDRGPRDGGAAGESTVRMLRAADDAARAQICGALAGEAEYHGIAPLIEPMVGALSRTAPDAVPDDVRRAFVVMASRHRRAAIVREECIDRLLEAFADAGVPVILLKGAALAHLIYPGPELRPMADIDVLINPADAERAVAIARGLGYAFASRHVSRFAGRMHHLPVGATTRAGFRIALEIHLDTMSPDQSDGLTFATLTTAPQRFRRRSGPDGVALGHADMLRHLAHHAFEPARRVRLIHLYDLWRYQAMFGDEIDWLELASRSPRVAVVLRLASQVFAGPGAADRGSGAEPVPAGLGLGMVPLSEIAAADIGPLSKLAAVFNPPAWWLHGFYGVPPERSLLLCRTVRHPARVARWLARRLAAGAIRPAGGDTPRGDALQAVKR